MNRVVVVTGVAGGIGRAIASHFAELGWTVIGLDLREPRVPGITEQLVCDVADDDAMRAVFAGIAEKHGELHALVNNAAIQRIKPLLETTAREWDELMAVNVRGVFLGLKYAQPLLAASGAGAVVNVASVHAVASSPEIAAYATSKGAVLALTRAAALEFAPARIRVNAVLPGAVDTQMLRDGLQRDHAGAGEVDARLAALAGRTPLGRVGRPAEIARAVEFLADGAQSSFVTGQTLIIDGGACARLSTE